MEIIMLGTGNAVVTECYNTCFILSENSNYFLVDGGGGNTLLRQLKQAGIPWTQVKDIFVTHKHIDHLLGIIWMLRMICQNMNRGNYTGEANIYAHEEVISLLTDMAEKLLDKQETRFIGNRLHLITVTDKEERMILNRKITFFDILSTKAKQFGFCIELDHGEKLTCCGDEPYHESERQYVENSKWLLHEAFCLYSQADIFSPYQKHHSTVKDACELANKMNVKNLLLYHTEDKNIKNRKELYTAEGKQYYQGNLYIPDDLEVIEL